MMSLGLDKDYGEFGQCLFLNSSSNAVNVSKPLNLFSKYFSNFSSNFSKLFGPK